MKRYILVAACYLGAIAVPIHAQDDGGDEVIVTASRLSVPTALAPAKPPVVGLRRLADSAVRVIEITSDSRDVEMRRNEVKSMLMDAIDSAKRKGFSLVTGQFALVEVTRENWQDQFPGLSGIAQSEDDNYEDYGDETEDGAVATTFEDDGGTATIRLRVKTKLEGSLDNAQTKIQNFVKGVAATGRSQIIQRGGLSLTIIKPEQYRDEIYQRIAAAAKQAAGFYGPEYGMEIDGLDEEVAWKQVSNTELFLYIPYSFVIKK
jgi:hypothetical protein